MEDLSLWRWYYNGHSSPSDVIARREPWDNTLDSINKDLTFFCSFHKERNFPTLLYQWNHFSFFTLVTMKLLLLLLLGLFLCVQMHVCKCACVYVSMCIGSPEAACYPKLHHSLVFETVCHWTWSPRLQLGWPPVNFKDLPTSTCPMLQLQTCSGHITFLWMLGIGTQILVLMRQALYG